MNYEAMLNKIHSASLDQCQQIKVEVDSEYVSGELDCCTYNDLCASIGFQQLTGHKFN